MRSNQGERRWKRGLTGSIENTEGSIAIWMSGYKPTMHAHKRAQKGHTASTIQLAECKATELTSDSRP